MSNGTFDLRGRRFFGKSTVARARRARIGGGWLRTLSSRISDSLLMKILGERLTQCLAVILNL